MDMCLVFGVETGRGVVGCAGAPVSGIYGRGVLKKATTRDIRDAWADGRLWLVGGHWICCTF